MAKIVKYNTGIINVIRHNIREYTNGKSPSNKEIDPSRSRDNYTIICRGHNSREINAYRKQMEAKCFKYNRKNLIHAHEVIFTLPKDCPPEQEKRFFQESVNYIASTTALGLDAIFLATVHADEGRIMKDGVTVMEGAKHLHVMYIPAVSDLKHENYKYKLCSDALTKRSVLKQWHPNYQKFLEQKGITASVINGSTSSTGLSVSALKELSKTTGLTLEQIRSLEHENTTLKNALNEQLHENKVLKDRIAELEVIYNYENTWGNNDTSEKEISMLNYIEDIIW